MDELERLNETVWADDKFILGMIGGKKPPLFIKTSEGDYSLVSEDYVIQTAKNLLREKVCGSLAVRCKDDLENFLRLQLGGEEHEVFAIIHLDTQLRIIAYVEMFRGTIDECRIYPREVLKEILENNSSAVILVHNHPSDQALPSDADQRLTRALAQLLTQINVRVLDHLIVTKDEVFSFSSHGLI